MKFLIAMILAAATVGSGAFFGPASPSTIERRSAVTRDGDKYSVDIEKQDVRVVLADLCTLGDAMYRLDIEVQGVISVKLDGASFEDALTRVAREAGATFEVFGKEYRIRPMFGCGIGGEVKRIERKYVVEGDRKGFDLIQIESADLRMVLLDLSDISGVDIVVESDVQGVVSLHVKGVRLEEALDAIMERVAATYEKDGDEIRVRKRRDG